MYKLIMFDLDGTLLDSYRSIALTFEDTIRHFGLREVSDDEMTTMIGPRVYDSFVNRFGQSHEKATEMTEWFRNDYVEKHLFDASLYPGIIDLLRELKSEGFRTAIVTNKRYDYTNDLADHFDLAPLFDGIYGTDFENKVQKHQLIGQCLKDFDVSPKEAVMIGDTEFDKKAADRCGVDFLPVSYGFGKWDIECCDDAGQILNKLSKTNNV